MPYEIPWNIVDLPQALRAAGSSTETTSQSVMGHVLLLHLLLQVLKGGTRDRLLGISQTEMQLQELSKSGATEIIQSLNH